MKYDLKVDNILPLLPSLHDCKIESIFYKDKQLIIRLNDIQDYDIITDQNILENKCDLIINIEDESFCQCQISKILWKRINFHEKHSNGYKTKIYDFPEFIKKANKEKFDIDIIDIYVSWCSIIIKTSAFTKEYNLELSANSVEYIFYD